MHPSIEKTLCALQRALPQRLLTAGVHRLARSERPWLKNALITVIGSAAGVDWTEASSMELDDYRSFNAFFTRELRPGARQLDPDPGSLCCPSDGKISECGELQGDRILQAKGHHYALDELLAGDPACESLRGGHFWTVYLSPRDYHRVHMPAAGELRRMTYVPGDLFSVAPYTVRQVPGLFARNERVVSVFDTTFGPMAVVLVGAMLVASMDTVWAGTVTPAATRAIQRTNYGPGEVGLPRGAEMGRFNMGSTVVLLVPRGALIGAESLRPDQPVRMGQRLAQLA